MNKDRFDSVVLDASVVAKLLTKEQNSEKAAVLLENLVKQERAIIEPHFLKIEIYSLIRKKISLKDIRLNQGRKALFLFNQLAFDYFVESNDLLNISFSLAKKMGQTVIYDCLYLSLAQAKKAKFITADLKFLKQARKFYSQSFSLSDKIEF